MEEKKIKCKKCKREYYNLSDEQDYKCIDDIKLCIKCLEKELPTPTDRNDGIGMAHRFDSLSDGLNFYYRRLYKPKTPKTPPKTFKNKHLC